MITMTSMPGPGVACPTTTAKPAGCTQRVTIMHAHPLWPKPLGQADPPA